MKYWAAFFVLFAAITPAYADSALYADPQRGLELELGTLDPSNSDPLLGTSPYFGIRKYGSTSGKWFDWDYDTKAFALDLSARYGEGSPSASATLFLGSALGRVGRAYPLFGPIDVGWSVMGVMRASDLFPNLSLDETAAVRWRLNDHHAMGYFTGLTQSAVEGGRTWTESRKKERTAAHDAVAFWGTTRKGVGYRVEVGRQENPSTHIDTLSSSFLIPSGGDPVSLRARIEEEHGDSLEFHRTRTSIGSDFRIGRSWDMGVDIGVDDVDFGGVETKSRSLMLSFRYRPKKSRSLVRLQTTQTARRDAVPPAGELTVARRVYEAVQALDAALSRLEAELDAVAPAEAAQALADAVAGLPPVVRDALERELGDLDAERLARLIEQAKTETAAARRELSRIAETVGDPALLERLAVHAARKELYATLAKQEFDILGETVRLTPPQLIALAHAYSLSNDPLPPVTSRDIDNWIGGECGGALRACLLSRLPPELRPTANAAWSDEAALEESVRWAADLAKREVNRLLLNVMLAAERLDALTVGGGLRPGELNNRAVSGSFDALDRRRSGRLAPVFAKAGTRFRP